MSNHTICTLHVQLKLYSYCISLQPPNTPKRVQDDDNEEEDFENEFERQRKMRKLAKSRATDAGLVERTQKAQQKEPEEAVRAEKPLTDEEREKILKLVESEEFEVCIFNFTEIFNFGGMKKSYGANLGEYGEDFNAGICFLAKNFFTKSELWKWSLL